MGKAKRDFLRPATHQLNMGLSRGEEGRGYGLSWDMYWSKDLW